MSTWCSEPARASLVLDSTASSMLSLFRHAPSIGPRAGLLVGYITLL